MLIIVLIVLILFSPLQGALGEEKACLRYEPVAVKLTGAVIFRTFSDANGNPELSPLLLLDHPVCVEAAGGDRINESEYDVIAVHLVVELKEFGQLRKLMGRSVTTRGTLFHKFNAHHHAAVLLTVKNIQELNR